MVEEDDPVAFPADKQGLGARTGRGPTGEDGVKISCRVPAQNEHTQRPICVRRVEDGHQHGQAGEAVGVKVEVLKRYLARAHGLGCTLRQDGDDGPRLGRHRHAGNALCIQQADLLILILTTVLAEPELELALRVRVRGLFQNAPHQGGDVGVLEEYAPIAQPLLAPPHQVAHLQLSDGQQRFLYAGAVVPHVTAVVEGADGKNARR